MALYKPTELRAFLSSLGIAPKKALSQNFLIDGNIIRNIVKAAEIKPGDQVLEIGPGPGSLTEELINQGAHVVAIETDRILAKALERLKPAHIITGDALKIPLDEIYPFFDQARPIKLLGNLPYHITTPLITRFISHVDRFSTILVMVQEEVARRMSALSGTAEYGSITLFLNFYAKIHYAFKVSRNCFYPVPNVDSAMIRLDLHPAPQGIDADLFFQLTRRAFQQRRKTLRQSLKELYPLKISNALETLKFPSEARPEELSLEQFIQLFLLLNQKI